MNTFLVIAAVMAAIAASAVALPLLRHRQSRVLGAVAAVIIIGAAALLYPLWSNWNWRAPAQSAAGPDVAAMVAKLEKHLQDQPGDLTGLADARTLLPRAQSVGRCPRRLRPCAPTGRQECGRRHGVGRSHEPAGGGRNHAGGFAAVRGGLERGSRQPTGAACTAALRPPRAATGRSRAAAGRHSRACIRRRRSNRCSMRVLRNSGRPVPAPRRRDAPRWDECVACGDEHVGRGLKRRGSHCQYQHRTRVEITLGIGGPLVRLCT